MAPGWLRSGSPGGLGGLSGRRRGRGAPVRVQWGAEGVAVWGRDACNVDGRSSRGGGRPQTSAAIAPSAILQPPQRPHQHRRQRNLQANRDVQWARCAISTCACRASASGRCDGNNGAKQRTDTGKRSRGAKRDEIPHVSCVLCW